MRTEAKAAAVHFSSGKERVTLPLPAEEERGERNSEAKDLNEVKVCNGEASGRIQAQQESTGHGAEANEISENEEFISQEGTENAENSRRKHGQADCCCRRKRLIALVVLTALSLAIIVLAGTQSKAPADPSALPPPADPSALPPPADPSALPPPADPSALPPPADHCADGWIWYRGKCYFFSEEIRDWNESQSFCTSHNASLAVIETQQELNFTNHHKEHSNHWIGLRREKGKPWKWPDGSEFNNLFNISQKSDCAYLNDASASSARCSMHRKCICTQPAWPHYKEGRDPARPLPGTMERDF
ncbi:early activation antigen CD69-like [Rhinatrema bivittatum]|uniref:early activation antigen CD69-like n=1 Tax=Rhinatrema bivittatum TaxID=194408 RepID=UPI00112B4267|nr:early activation antigen CD69-like [Rhinatrema bivittatum]